MRILDSEVLFIHWIKKDMKKKRVTKERQFFVKTDLILNDNVNMIEMSKGLEVKLKDESLPEVIAHTTPALILFHKYPDRVPELNMLSSTIIDLHFYQYLLPIDYKSTIEVPYMYYISKDNVATLVNIEKTKTLTENILHYIGTKVTIGGEWKNFSPFI